MPTAFPGFAGSGSAGTASRSDHNHSGTYEPVIANPAYDGMLLASSAAGTRSWVYPTSNATASTVVSRDAAGNASFNVCLATRIYAAQRVDAPVVENDAAGGVIEIKLNGITVGTFTLNGLELASGKAVRGSHQSADGSEGFSSAGPITWSDGSGLNHIVHVKNGLITSWTIDS